MLQHVPFPVLPAPPSWYPGHMTQFTRLLPTLLRRTDVVLELRDARLPLTSINRNFEGVHPLFLFPIFCFFRLASLVRVAGRGAASPRLWREGAAPWSVVVARVYTREARRRSTTAGVGTLIDTAASPGVSGASVEEWEEHNFQSVLWEQLASPSSPAARFRILRTANDVHVPLVRTPCPCLRSLSSCRAGAALYRLLCFECKKSELPSFPFTDYRGVQGFCVNGGRKDGLPLRHRQ